ncbi:hypothetical protein R80B4_02369 [Fibrobacteres bacterium R8-0-B4]
MIRQEDIDRVIESAKTVKIPEEYEQLHVIPQNFQVDNLEGINKPLGMLGVRLKTTVHIITAQTTTIQNITKCVMDAGLLRSISEISRKNAPPRPRAALLIVLKSSKSTVSPGAILPTVNRGRS